MRGYGRDHIGLHMVREKEKEKEKKNEKEKKRCRYVQFNRVLERSKSIILPSIMN